QRDLGGSRPALGGPARRAQARRGGRPPLGSSVPEEAHDLPRPAQGAPGEGAGHGVFRPALPRSYLRPARRPGRGTGPLESRSKADPGVRVAKKKDRYIVGLDIGTHKICAIVAELSDEGRLDVIGIGQTESKGLRKGVVINLEATVDAIKRVLEEA